MGLDVHDVPSASRPVGSGKYFVNDSNEVSGLPGGHKDFYKYLRLRLELRAGMVVVGHVVCMIVLFAHQLFLKIRLLSQAFTFILPF